MNVVVRDVTKAERVLRQGGSTAWGFWDVKAKFQHVRWDGLEETLIENNDGRRWVSWIQRLYGFNEFGVSWDGEVSGRGSTTNGMPQRSPLSLVLFLICLAPILEFFSIFFFFIHLTPHMQLSCDRRPWQGYPTAPSTRQKPYT